MLIDDVISEFFTMSMRWRHRLVLRDQRRERRKRQKIVPKEQRLRLTKSSNDVLSPSSASSGTPSPRLDGMSKSNPTAPSVKAAKSSKAIKSMASLLSHTPNLNNDISPSSNASTKNRMQQTSRRLLALHDKDEANEAATHIRGLPFPILTFGMLSGSGCTLSHCSLFRTLCTLKRRCISIETT